MRRCVRGLTDRMGTATTQRLPTRAFTMPDPQALLTSPTGLFALLSGRQPATGDPSRGGGHNNDNSNQANHSHGDKGEGEKSRSPFFNRDAVALAAMIFVLSAIWEIFTSQKDTLARKLKEALFITLEVRSSREEYAMIVDWMGRQPHGQRSRNISLMPLSVQDESKHEGTDADAVISDVEENIHSLFVPGFGSHYMTFHHTRLWISRAMDTSKQHRPSSRMDREDEVLHIVFFSRDREVVRRFMDEVRASWSAQAQSTIRLYLPTGWGNRWDLLAHRMRRPLSTLYLPGDTLAVVDEARLFLRSRALYGALGVPWRRGYLLEGPPGTGKTSFILVLASELGLPVYLLSLQSRELDDAALIGLINAVPPRSLLVIEDLESAVKSGDAQSTEVGGGRDAGVSLSALLNAMDGVASSEGRLLVITANDASRLPAPHALLRPGRVDRRIRFGPLGMRELGEMRRAFEENAAAELPLLRGTWKSWGHANHPPRTPAEMQNEFLSAFYSNHTEK